ncbi:MAG: hypothetical protein M1839_001938 [Geoglossum umbratile]|nr:MAG: hypothetical protein M1839_001938 [Geoglossum umbratile]
MHQNDRMRALEDENKRLRQKIDLLFPSAVTAMRENNSQDMQFSPHSLLASHNLLEPPMFDLPGSIQPDMPPFSSPTHHLLSLHESLRTEVDHLAANLSDLEAKQSMMLMNESLRTNEELAGVRAAIGAIRMQVQWLMSQRLQSGRQPARPGAVAGPSRGGPGGGSHNASTSAARRLSGKEISRANGMATRLTHTADTTRQDVKL